MKGKLEQRKASGVGDYLALALTTFGVGYIPGAPGTYGSAVGVFIYAAVNIIVQVTVLAPMVRVGEIRHYYLNVLVIIALTVFTLIGIWASDRTEAIFGDGDPSQAVVDEVIGQLIVFCFVPFGVTWPFVLAGFLLFRIFDIIKPFPANQLQDLPGGLGICADDIVAGFYAGICLAIGYAVTLAL